MSLRTLLSATCFALAFVINPAYFAGCASSEEDTEFGEAEMLELLDAANEQGVWELQDGDARYEIELSLMQAEGEDAHARAPVASAFAATAHACGTRTFMQSASACVTFTEVPLVGELTVRQLEPEARVLVDAMPIEGRLWTDAARLLFATIDIDLDLGDSRVVLHSDDAKTFELQSVRLQLEDGVVEVGEAR